jgi:hypothetical protein
VSARLTTALALALALVSCTTGHTYGGSPEGTPAVVAEAPPADGAAVFLRGRAELLAPDLLTFDVVARSAVDLHGAAFRMTWDPEALAFVSAASGPAWSKRSLALAKEAQPGQLLVAWTEKGELAIAAAGEVVLGTLRFERRGRDGAALAFTTPRSRLVDKTGANVAAAWRGATITAR